MLAATLLLTHTDEGEYGIDLDWRGGADGQNKPTGLCWLSLNVFFPRPSFRLIYSPHGHFRLFWASSSKCMCPKCGITCRTWGWTWPV